MACAANSAEKNGNCIPCPAHHYSYTGATECRPCAPVMFRSEGMKTCQPCQDQHVFDLETGQCEKCKSNEIILPGMTACQPCKPSHFAVNASSCKPCPLPQQVFQDGSCRFCPKGFFFNESVSGCEPCHMFANKICPPGMVVDNCHMHDNVQTSCACNECVRQPTCKSNEILRLSQCVLRSKHENNYQCFDAHNSSDVHPRHCLFFLNGDLEMNAPMVQAQFYLLPADSCGEQQSDLKPIAETELFSHLKPAYFTEASVAQCSFCCVADYHFVYDISRSIFACLSNDVVASSVVTV